MLRPQIVVDTNVLIAALRSNRGASYRLLTLIGQGLFGINLSVPLVLEYEGVASRPGLVPGLPLPDLSDILDYLCAVADLHSIFYLWRPFLSDPKDDMVLELAVEAQCDFIITFNKKHFAGIEQFGLQALTPQEFLRKIGALS